MAGLTLPDPHPTPRHKPNPPASSVTSSPRRRSSDLLSELQKIFHAFHLLSMLPISYPCFHLIWMNSLVKGWGTGGGVQRPWVREDGCWLGVSLPFTPFLATLLTLVSRLLPGVCSDKILSLTPGPSQIGGRKGSTLGTWLLEGHCSFCADTSGAHALNAGIDGIKKFKTSAFHTHCLSWTFLGTFSVLFHLLFCLFAPSPFMWLSHSVIFPGDTRKDFLILLHKLTCCSVVSRLLLGPTTHRSTHPICQPIHSFGFCQFSPKAWRTKALLL